MNFFTKYFYWLNFHSLIFFIKLYNHNNNIACILIYNTNCFFEMACGILYLNTYHIKEITVKHRVDGVPNKNMQ